MGSKKIKKVESLVIKKQRRRRVGNKKNKEGGDLGNKIKKEGGELVSWVIKIQRRQRVG